MNAAGPSKNQRTSAETSAQADRDPSRDEAGAHPLVGALQLWTVASLTSLLLSVGLARSLRGAFIGAQPWIAQVDRIADRSSQFAAICTALLLVYVGMLSARASKVLGAGMVAAFLGAPATMLLFLAHRHTLPQTPSWFAAICAGLALLVCASQARTRPIIKTVVALGACTLLAQTLRTGEGPEILTRTGSLLHVVFAWSTLLTAFSWHIWSARKQPWRGPLLLGAAALLAASASASSQPDVSRTLLIVGRSLTELAHHQNLGSTSPLLFSLALLLVLSSLLRSPSSLGQLVVSVLALACAAPTTPLVVSWILLCGFASVVICWVPASSDSEPQH